MPLKRTTKFFGVSSIESFENKLTVLLTTGFYLALYLFVTELLVMSYRFKLLYLEYLVKTQSTQNKTQDG